MIEAAGRGGGAVPGPRPLVSSISPIFPARGAAWGEGGGLSRREGAAQGGFRTHRARVCPERSCPQVRKGVPSSRVRVRRRAAGGPPAAAIAQDREIAS